MLGPRLIAIALCSSLAAAGNHARVALGARHEPGVETRVPLVVAGEVTPLAGLRVAGGIDLNLAGTAVPERYALEAGWSPVRFIELGAGAILHRWPAWRAGENLAFASLRARPVERLELEAGVARRVPLLDTASWSSPVNWSSPLAEWNIVYRIGWHFLDRPGLRAAVSTGNHQLLALRTPGLIGLRLEGEKSLRTGWTVTAALAGEMKGLSSALAELGAVELELGVKREF